MLIGSKYAVKNTRPLQPVMIILDGKPMKQLDYFKYLGIYIDHCLTWSKHGRFPFDQKFRKFWVGEWMEQTIPETLGVPCEVGLKFRKIGMTGKFLSIRTFLLGPSFSEPAIELNMAEACHASVLVVFLCGRWLKYIIAPLLHQSGHSKLW